MSQILTVFGVIFFVGFITIILEKLAKRHDNSEPQDEKCILKKKYTYQQNRSKHTSALLSGIEKEI